MEHSSKERIRLTTDDLKKRFAYVRKNFLQLSFEQQIILLANAVTALFCFFPWISIEPFSRDWNFRNAFTSELWMAGGLVFLLAVGTAGLLLNDLFQARKITLPIRKTLLFFLTGMQSLLFLLISWSSLLGIATLYGNADIRFGIAVCFVAQVMAVVASYMQLQSEKTDTAKDFFQLPRV